VTSVVVDTPGAGSCEAATGVTALRPPGGSAPGTRGAGAWMRAALDLVFPALCPVCAAPLDAGRRDPLCGRCWSAIERVAPPWCEVCGVPFARFAGEEGGARPGRRCHGCAVAPPPFAWARAGGVYAGPLREAIQAFKFQGKQALARPLAGLVLEQSRALLPGLAAVVPVPLAAARERERGFNQALLLAGRIGADAGVPVRPRWLRRTRPTAPQADLPAADRSRNVRGAFAGHPAVEGLDVALVDDVFTTGATAGECVRALSAAGARRVGVLTVARVVPGSYTGPEQLR
jgi:ComF family protein